MSREADELREVVRVMRRMTNLLERACIALDRQHRETEEALRLLRRLAPPQYYPATVEICVKID